MPRNNVNPIDAKKLSKLRDAAGEGPVLILTHHNPDPDGLASGAGMAVLFKEAWDIPTRLVYTGLVARVENHAMIKYLTPDWEQLKFLSKIYRYSAVAIVDTQPGCGNNLLPEEFKPKIVIDHHMPICTDISLVSYSDLRSDIGATSTMIYQYLEAAGVEIDSRLATALFYGLKTDTRGLSRGASKYDENAYFKLLSQVDHQLLTNVEQAQLPKVYFQAFHDALHSTRIYGKAVLTTLGEMHRPDLPAEISDLLIRLDGARAVLCIGEYNGILNLSLRTSNPSLSASILIQKIVSGMGMAGGHLTIAGGQIPLEDITLEKMERKITKRFLDAMDETKDGKSLLEFDD